MTSRLRRKKLATREVQRSAIAKPWAASLYRFAGMLPQILPDFQFLDLQSIEKNGAGDRT